MAKRIEFRGSSLSDLRAFPSQVRRRAGFQLDRVQNGLDPADWKPMPAIGRGVREIRVWDPSGTFRVIYVATIGETVFVLHCFGKKTRKTDRHDLDVAKKRYRDLLSDERP